MSYGMLSILKTVIQKLGASVISSGLIALLNDAMCCVATVFIDQQLFAEFMKGCMKSTLQRLGNWASLDPKSEFSES